MMKNEMMQQKLENYIKNNATVQGAWEDLERDTLEALEDWFANLDESDILNFAQEELNRDIHIMDDLDEVFMWMRPTEVLCELSDIDLDDEYFDAESRESFNDLEDYLNLNARDIAQQIFDGDIDVFYYYWMSDAKEIMQDYEWYYRKLEYHYSYREKMLTKARELFEKALAQNPEELISVLWNINMTE